MPRCKIRKQCDKVIENEKFVPIDGFFLGKLPTLKNVITRCLYYRNYLTDKTLTTVSEELFNRWIKYNVYPISIAGIRKRLRTEMTEFNMTNLNENRNITVMSADSLKKVRNYLMFFRRTKNCIQGLKKITCSK